MGLLQGQVTDHCIIQSGSEYANNLEKRLAQMWVPRLDPKELLQNSHAGLSGLYHCEGIGNAMGAFMIPGNTHWARERGIHMAFRLCSKTIIIPSDVIC